ncbi:MAG: ribonuclease III [Anaerolineales bacterium]
MSDHIPTLHGLPIAVLPSPFELRAKPCFIAYFGHVVLLLEERPILSFKKSFPEKFGLQFRPLVLELRERRFLTSGEGTSLPEFSGRSPVTPQSQQRDIEPASDLSVGWVCSFFKFSPADLRALTHRSYATNIWTSNEDNNDLNFGDAVLDFIVGEWAYNRFPEMPEGNLTKICSALVRNEQLANFARHIHLSAALRLGRGEQTSGGNARESVLGSAFEALVGALYLDTGLDEVRRFVNPLLEWRRESVLDEIQDPKSELQEHSQALKLGMPHYKVVRAHGPDHAKVFEMEVEIAGEVKGRGTGTSKSNAEHAAAKDALNNLGIK